ncbi:MAG: NADH-quinone oxidoreductase subunit N [Gammaproteobacteria bacterium]|nr:NADH-quinone oxidoreductase subunit N [Gammaproteobacteria bacterium]
MSASDVIPVAISGSDLLALAPHIALSVTIVFVMLLIGIKRIYAISSAVSMVGLGTSAVLAFVQFYGALSNDTSQQITPLFRIDLFSLFFIAIICCAAFSLSVFAYSYFMRLKDDQDEYQLLLLLAALGGVTLASSTHFIGALIGLEMMSMALYGMLAYPVHSHENSGGSLESAFKYLILSAVASATMLFGIGLLYTETGLLTVIGVGEFGSDPSALIGIGLLFIFAGMAFKLSLAPFHLWTPDVYEGGPMPASAFLATVGKIAVAAFMLRLIAHTNALSIVSVNFAVLSVAIFSVLLGNLLALRQQNLKRLLAYSSIAHMGYLLIAILSFSVESDGSVSLGTGLAIDAVVFYLLAYMVMSLGAFGCASLISSSERESDSIADYTGLFWRSPWLAVVLTSMLLSLAGIPLTGGFISKFLVFFAAVEASQWLLLFVLVVGSGIGLYYYLRVIFQMLQTPSKLEPLGIKRSNWETLGAVLMLFSVTAGTLVLGVYPEPILNLVEQIGLSL